MELNKSGACWNRWAVLILIAASFLTAGWMTTAIAGQEKTEHLKDNIFILAANRPPSSGLYQFWHLFYSEIFKRLDIQLDMRYYPIKRAAMMAVKGLVDGNAARVYEYAAYHPNLLRVEESVYQLHVVAYTAAPSSLVLNGWEALKNTNYKVEYLRGMVISRHNLEKVVEKENLSPVTTAAQGLKKLVLHRSDLYVDDKAIVLPLINDPKLNLKGKIHAAGIMGTVSVYMYVHKKHKALVPRLEKVIQGLKAEGAIQKAFDEVFGAL